jgi:hypothetical protein
MAGILDHNPDVFLLRKQQTRFDVVKIRDVDRVFDVISRKTRIIAGSVRIAGCILEERGHEVRGIVKAGESKHL